MTDVSWAKEPGAAGVAIASFRDASAGDLVEVARLADELGYSSAWVSEDYTREAFALLGAMAGATRRIHVGTGIVGIYSRTAALMTQALATVDDLSDGRAFLGLGLGDLRLAAEWHGGNTTQLAPRLRDYVLLMRTLLRGEGEYAGATMQARNLQLGFQPRRTEIPIFLASLSEGTMSVVRETADGWLPMTVPLSYVRRVRQDLGEKVPVALYTICCVDEDREAARGNARMMLAYFLALMPPLRRIVAEEFPDADLDGFMRRWRDGERREAAAAISDALVDSLAVAGTPRECRDMLSAYEDEGVYPIVSVPYRSTPSTIESTLRALAPSTAK